MTPLVWGRESLLLHKLIQIHWRTSTFTKKKWLMDQDHEAVFVRLNPNNINQSEEWVVATQCLGLFSQIYEHKLEA